MRGLVRRYLGSVICTGVGLFAGCTGVAVCCGAITAFILLPLFWALVILVPCLVVGAVIITVFVNSDDLSDYIDDKVDEFFELRDRKKELRARMADEPPNHGPHMAKALAAQEDKEREKVSQM